jgi:hypothetical protein
MAEFKISRIRFKWAGKWTAGTDYVKDDIVNYGAKTYVCLVGHTASANFYTDLENIDTTTVPNTADPKWELQVDGYTWRSDWAPGEFYNLGDIVKYNGMIYICVQHHTSDAVGLFNQYSKWITYVKGELWRQDWQISTRYGIGDVVKYNGYLYRCTYSHVSGNNTVGLESNASFWQLVEATEKWKTNWDINVRYREGDIVKYGGTVYRCIAGHTSASTFALGLESDIYFGDSTVRWEVVYQNIEYKSDWTALTRYKLNDVVKYGGGLWICSTFHTSTSSFQDANWTVYVPGSQFEDAWSGITVYQIGDVVRYGGYFYTALKNNVGTTPSLSTGDSTVDTWQLLIKNYEVTGEWDQIYNYKVGDIVRRSGQVYSAVKDNSSTDPTTDNGTNWLLVIPGSKWKNFWTINTTYVIGDIVSLDSNAYRCIKTHISVNSLRPDLDTSQGNFSNGKINDSGLYKGIYWETYTYGEPTNRLRLQGDLSTYALTEDGSSIGLTRLSIGTEGQALRVISGTANWYNFGVRSKVYYVGPDGIDQPNNGTSLNAPWKTIAYACSSITGPATIFVKVGMYFEKLPISIPADVAVVGEELRSTIVKPAVGYETSNMFYVRNGTGLRNMTLMGLSGTLGPFDAYITRRPTAGAYVSLDPGNGPTDTAVQITTKSPYVQNVTTFGTACTGLKIDGSLHNSGNRSVVANDFTQVLSDGIGVWCTNLGLTELVSVFSYYGHIGYLAENGGKIRATNGNSSYGLYGTVALGFDTTESPITGKVDNRSKQAQVKSAFSGEANDFILRLEFSNAGQSYTSATYAFTGSGVNAITVADEFRDNAVFEAQVVDNLGTSNNYGGAGYYNIGNNAAAGNTTTFTGSTGDKNTYDIYRGMRAIIQSGTGTGQYGYVVDFNTTSKIFSIAKESFTALTVTSSSGSNFTVADTSMLYQGMPVFIDYQPINTTATAVTVSGVVLASVTGMVPGMPIKFTSSTVYGGITQNYVYYINTIVGNTVSLYSSYGSGAVSLTAFSNISMTVQAGGLFGTGVAQGTLYTIASIPSGTTFTLTGITPGSFAGVMRLHAAGWDHVNPGYPIVPLLDTTSVYRIEPRPVFSTPTYSNASGAIAGSGSWISMAYGAVSGGSIYLAITTSGSIAYSNNGVDWSSAAMPSSGGGTWASVAYGNGRFVAVAANSSTAATTTNGFTWNTATLPSNSVWASVTYDNYNTTWTAVSAASGTIAAKSTDGGATWSSQTLSKTGFWGTVASGGGVTVALSSGSSDASYIRYGDAVPTWTTAVLPASATWTDVSYGNGKFTAVASGTNAVAISYNGSTWVSGNPLPFSSNWSSIAYGQGAWVACSSTATAGYATSEDGIWWIPRQSTVTQGRSFVAFGNPSNVGKFVMLPSSGSVTDIVTQGSRTRGRINLNGAAVDNIKLWEPGSNYSSATCTVTDPNATTAAVVNCRLATGVLGSPSFVNRGVGFKTSTTVTTVSGNGFADILPFGSTIILKNVSRLPRTGANLTLNQILWSQYSLPSSATWSEITYGNGKFVAVASGTTTAAYSVDGTSWTATTLPGSAATWISVAYGNNKYIAVAQGRGTAARSIDGGLTWAGITLPSSANWSQITYGAGKWIIVALGSSSAIWSNDDGTTWNTSALPSSGNWSAVTYGNNEFFAVKAGTSVSALSLDGVNWTQKNLTASGNWTNIAYGLGTYVFIQSGSSTVVYTTDLGNTSNTANLPSSANWSKIVFGYRNFVAVASDTATLATSTDGITWKSRAYPLAATGGIAHGPSTYVAVGTSTVAIGSDFSTDIQYKVLTITNTSGGSSNYAATLTVSPSLNKTTSPVDSTDIEIREKYSQVRLTGHDMLAIGTGNKDATNYPYEKPSDYLPGNETYFRGGGRVFYTTTDQDGNFRVGQLFAVQQATGIITISADYFNLSGLSQLALGGIAVGGSATIITEFSTDATFTADSNSIIPTQKAIKQYIARRVSGGGSNAATGTLVAGTVSIGPRTITSTTGLYIKIPVKMNFKKGVDGVMTAMTYFTESFGSGLDFQDTGGRYDGSAYF